MKRSLQMLAGAAAVVFTAAPAAAQPANSGFETSPVINYTAFTDNYGAPVVSSAALGTVQPVAGSRFGLLTANEPCPNGTGVCPNNFVFGGVGNGASSLVRAFFQTVQTDGVGTASLRISDSFTLEAGTFSLAANFLSNPAGQVGGFITNTDFGGVALVNVSAMSGAFLFTGRLVGDDVVSVNTLGAGSQYAAGLTTTKLDGQPGAGLSAGPAVQGQFTWQSGWYRASTQVAAGDYRLVLFAANQDSKEEDAAIAIDAVTFTPTPSAVVPEPSTYALMATGLAALGGIARRRRTV